MLPMEMFMLQTQYYRLDHHPLGCHDERSKLSLFPDTRDRETSLFIAQYQVMCILVCACCSLKDGFRYIDG